MRDKRVSVYYFLLLSLFFFLAFNNYALHPAFGNVKPSLKNLKTDPFDKDAVTTSLKDAYPSARWIENFDRYFKNYGSFKSLKQLTTGLNRIELKSYCLKPGVPVNNPNTYSYVLGPLKGTKAKLLTEIVKRAAKHPKIEHKFVQTLIWGIIAGISYSDYPDDFAKKISPLLPDEEKNKKSGTSLKDLMKLPVSNEIKAQLSIISDLRSLISDGINRFEDLERIAVPNVDAVVSKDDVKIDENCWTLTEDGYYVRPKPGHYSRTKLDVYKPEQVSVSYDEKGRVSKMSSATGVLEFEYDENAGADVITYPSKNSYKINRISMVKLDGEPIGKIMKMLWYAEQDFQTSQTSTYKRKEVGINVDPLEETFKSRDAKIKQLFEYFAKYNGGKKLSKEEEKEMYALKQIEYSMKFVLDTLRFQVTKEETIEKVLRIATDASVERFTSKASTHSLKSGGRTESLFDVGMTVAVPGNNAQRIGVTGTGSEEDPNEEGPPITVEDPDPPIGRDTSRTPPNCRLVLKQVDLNLLPAPNQLFMAMFEVECDQRIKEIEWTLFDISKEKGRCLNDKDPAYYKPEPDKDLTIEVSENEYYTMTETPTSITAKGGSAAPHYIVIKANDYGGFGKLSVRIKVRDTYFQATCEGWGNSFINIPYDMDDNKIADKWEFDNGVAGYPADWDQETIPTGQATNGDGITNYEEYRGFYQIEATGDAIHTRTNPMRKEIFIVDNNRIFSTYMWENASEIRSYFVNENYMKASLTGDNLVNNNEFRRVNFCKGYAAGEKFAVYLIGVSGLVDPYYSVCAGLTDYWGCSNYGPPVNVNYTIVMPDRIRAFYHKMKDTLNYVVANGRFSEYSEWTDSTTICDFASILNNPDQFEALVNYSVNVTSTHEVGHACGVRHHSPDPFAGFNRCVMKFTLYFDRIFNFLFTHLTILRESGTEGIIPILAVGNWHFCKTDHNCWGQLKVNDRLP